MVGRRRRQSSPGGPARARPPCGPRRAGRPWPAARAARRPRAFSGFFSPSSSWMARICWRSMYSRCSLVISLRASSAILLRSSAPALRATGSRAAGAARRAAVGASSSACSFCDVEAHDERDQERQVQRIGSARRTRLLLISNGDLRPATRSPTSSQSRRSDKRQRFRLAADSSGSGSASNPAPSGSRFRSTLTSTTRSMPCTSISTMVGRVRLDLADHGLRADGVQIVCVGFSTEVSRCATTMISLSSVASAASTAASGRGRPTDKRQSAATGTAPYSSSATGQAFRSLSLFSSF